MDNINGFILYVIMIIFIISIILVILHDDDYNKYDENIDKTISICKNLNYSLYDEYRCYTCHKNCELFNYTYKQIIRNYYINFIGSINTCYCLDENNTMIKLYDVGK